MCKLRQKRFYNIWPWNEKNGISDVGVVDDSGTGSGVAVGYSGTGAGVVVVNIVFAVVFINAGDGNYFCWWYLCW